jgi:hypothetical protein
MSRVHRLTTGIQTNEVIILLLLSKLSLRMGNRNSIMLEIVLIPPTQILISETLVLETTLVKFHQRHHTLLPIQTLIPWRISLEREMQENKLPDFHILEDGIYQRNLVSLSPHIAALIVRRHVQPEMVVNREQGMNILLHELKRIAIIKREMRRLKAVSNVRDHLMPCHVYVPLTANRPAIVGVPTVLMKL